MAVAMSTTGNFLDITRKFNAEGYLFSPNGVFRVHIKDIVPPSIWAKHGHSKVLVKQWSEAYCSEICTMLGRFQNIHTALLMQEQAVVNIAEALTDSSMQEGLEDYTTDARNGFVHELEDAALAMKALFQTDHFQSSHKRLTKALLHVEQHFEVSTDITVFWLTQSQYRNAFRREFVDSLELPHRAPFLSPSYHGHEGRYDLPSEFATNYGAGPNRELTCHLPEPAWSNGMLTKLDPIWYSSSKKVAVPVEFLRSLGLNPEYFDDVIDPDASAIEARQAEIVKLKEKVALLEDRVALMVGVIADRLVAPQGAVQGAEGKRSRHE